MMWASFYCKIANLRNIRKLAQLEKLKKTANITANREARHPMIEEVRPKTVKIEERMNLLIRKGEYADREAIARAIFRRWREAQRAGWTHGLGKKGNAAPPNPDQDNCQASWRAYVKGQRWQNLEGWQMVAAIMEVAVHEIVDVVSGIDAPPISFQSLPGDVPLSRLGNLDVSVPAPLQGANLVHSDEGRRQAVGLTVRPIFGTLRNEEILDPDGDVLAIGDVEPYYAHLIVDTSDPQMDILNGIGVNGEEVSHGPINCRYVGEYDGRIHFEVSAGGDRKTLAGTSHTLVDFVALEGAFQKDDWVGVGIDKGGLQIVKLEFNDTDAEASDDERSLRNQIKRQVLCQGIDLNSSGGPSHNISLAARRYFMKRIFNESDS